MLSEGAKAPVGLSLEFRGAPNARKTPQCGVFREAKAVSDMIGKLPQKKHTF